MKEKTEELFKDLENEWQKEWKYMPEFVQEDLTSYRKIVVHFRNSEDVKRFSELIGQKITPRQPSLWYPKQEIRKYADKEYIDES